MQNFPTTYKPQTKPQSGHQGCQEAAENGETCHTVGIRDLRISDAVRAAGREGYFIAADPAIQTIKDIGDGLRQTDRILDLREGYSIAAEEAPPPVSAEPEELSTNIRTGGNIGQLEALPWEVQ